MKELLNVRDYIANEPSPFHQWYYIKPHRLAALEAVLALYDVPEAYINDRSPLLYPAVFIDGKTLCK